MGLAVATASSRPYIAELGDALPVLAPILDALEGGLLVATVDGEILAANEALAAMIGLERAEVLAMTAPALLDRLAAQVDEPPALLTERALFPLDSQVVCEEIVISRPARAIVRWVARRVDTAGQTVAVVSCTDITAEVDLAAIQERYALTDRLTGLMNRRGLDGVLQREVSRRRRSGSALSLVLFDVDKFKAVNDVHGHAAGDEVLRAVAATIASLVRGSDAVGRWGGEEFLVILPDSGHTGALRCAERIRAGVEALSLPIGTITISAGLAEVAPDEALEEALKRADERLYAAKSAGRNRVL
jgi:diguanylate cyclase (GGDEF)-like protein